MGIRISGRNASNMKMLRGRNVLKIDQHRVELPDYVLNEANAEIRELAAKLRAAEERDPYTDGHQHRVGKLAWEIATRLGLSEKSVESIGAAAALHDLGKLLVPMEILTKQGKLDEVELETIHRHSTTGYEIISQVKLPWNVADIVRQHHERCDGSGYPRGLRGDEILPEAKVIAVADVFEAMTSDRPYRKALPVEVAIEEILNDRRYDSAAARACVELYNEGILEALNENEAGWTY
jgi:putative nucleotidyltransferase with HDIG domain